MNYLTYAKNYIEFFETLKEDTPYSKYEDIFIKDIYFEDPFQKTNSLKALHNIFTHMYKTLYEPRFYIKDLAISTNSAYIQWLFKYKRDKNAEFESFMGLSKVSFNSKGKVVSHIDYWDSATNIYEKIPLLGTLIRLIKKRIKA